MLLTVLHGDVAGAAGRGGQWAEIPQLVRSLVLSVLLLLLGLEPVPGSTIGNATNKLVVAETPSVLGIVNNGDGSVTVTFAGTPGAQYRVLATTDLASSGSWVNVSTNFAGPTGQWTYTGSSMTSDAERFFRAAKP